MNIIHKKPLIIKKSLADPSSKEIESNKLDKFHLQMSIIMSNNTVIIK